MPLCSIEVEQATTEDLHELSEFEKINPGQTRVLDSMLDIDNISQSLLALLEMKMYMGSMISCLITGHFSAQRLLLMFHYCIH